MAVDPYGRTRKRGVLLNYRTLEMLEITELRSLDRLGIVPLSLSQGSYNTSVSASAGTHAGGGALDVRVRNLNRNQREAVVYALRRTGFAAWLRTPAQGNWPYHIHAVAIGDKELSPAARQQVIDYRNGLNGLANKGPDDGPRVPWTVYRQDIDLSYYGPERWDKDDWRVFWAWVHGSNSRYVNLAQGGEKSTLHDEVQWAHKSAADARDGLVELDKKVSAILAAVTPPPV